MSLSQKTTPEPDPAPPQKGNKIRVRPKRVSKWKIYFKLGKSVLYFFLAIVDNFRQILVVLRHNKISKKFEMTFFLILDIRLNLLSILVDTIFIALRIY